MFLKSNLRNALQQSVSMPMIVAVVGLLMPHGVVAQSSDLDDNLYDELTIVGERLAPSKGDVTLASTRFDTDDLGQNMGFALDQLLDRDAGFSLFRRTTSFLSHPTTRGVSLRGFGTNGAGRALVTLDGVPLNDPFGGWVNWPLVEGNLADVTLYKGAGMGRWGSGALTGVIELTSQRITKSSAQAEIQVGSHNTGQVKVQAQQTFDGGGFYIYGQQFDSDGSYLVSKDQRGPIDTKAASRVTAVGVGLQYEFSAARLHTRAAFGKDDRINGLDESRNETDSADVSLSLISVDDFAELTWQLNSYYQSRKFENSFASVQSTFISRDGERRVLDQFDVPGSSFGANGLVRYALNALTDIELGSDIRFMDGETNELFRNLGGGFTRSRLAGGEQMIAGAFLRWSHTPLTALTVDASFRVDQWKVSDGVRREFNLENNRAIVRDDQFDNQSGTTPTGRFGVAFDAGLVTLSAAVYQGFRLPTINEYYRPFRVGNDITEANGTLKEETMTGIEAGLKGGLMNDGWWSVRGFYQNLKDGVGNVTLGFGPGVIAPGGFVPEGGVLRQRNNIDKSVALGLEAGFDAPINSYLNINASYQWLDSEVKEFSLMPALVGNRLPQSPKHRGRLGLVAKWYEGFQFETNVHYESARFEDDQSRRNMPSATWVSMRLDFPLYEQFSGFVWAENIANKEIVSRIGGDGIINVARPRQIMLGVKAQF